MDSETIMRNCMQSNTYGENKGTGFTGCPISKCRVCDAKRDCDRETWIRLGGTV